MRHIILGIQEHDPSVLYPQILKLVFDLDEKYIQLITKWAFLKAGTLIEIEKYDGSYIKYQGIMFDGSPETVFWSGFIQPYLENEPLDVMKDVANLANETNQNVAYCLDEAENLLVVMVQRVFEKMADMDQTLKGDGFKKGKRKNIAGYIEKVTSYIQEHRKIIELQASGASGVESSKDEDIIDLKPNFFGLGINLNAIWKKYVSK